MDENTERLPFAPSEAVALADDLRAKLSEEAKQRRAEGNARGGQGQVDGNLPSTSKAPPVRDQVAPAVGMSGRTYERARYIVQATAKHPQP